MNDNSASSIKDSNAVQQYSDNMNYFGVFYPEIFERFSDYQQAKYRLIAHDNGCFEVVTIEGERCYYHSKDNAQQEVKNFLDRLQNNNSDNQTDIPFASDFHIPRLFHDKLIALLEQSPLSMEDYQRGQRFDGHLPQLVILGIGLGFHVLELVEKTEINDLVLYEEDADLFYLSLFIVDWRTAIQSYSNCEYKRLSLLVGSSERIKSSRKLLRLVLQRNMPTYPTLTRYYVDQSNTTYQALEKLMLSESPKEFARWGNYDDEVNQLNHTRHNIEGSLNLKKAAEGVATPLSIPVMIIGSGPSIDQRVDELKQLAKTSLVVSCGSAITTLFRLGVHPDIHVEHESDYGITNSYLDAVGNDQALVSIPLMGPAQLNPHVIQRFKAFYAYVQKDTVLDNLIHEVCSDGIGAQHIAYSAPTCVNTGIALMLSFGFEKIMLFGVDLGFSTLDEHHASQSIYYDEEQPEIMQDEVNYDKYPLVQSVGVTGETIYSSALFLLTKERIERCIRMHDQPLTVTNYSMGLVIEGATYVPIPPNHDTESTLPETPEIIRQEKERYLATTLFCDDNFLQLPKNFIRARKRLLSKGLLLFYNDMTTLLDTDLSTQDGCHRVVMCINNYLKDRLSQTAPSVDVLCSNSVIMLNYAFISHIYHRDFPASELNGFVVAWRSQLLEFIDHVQAHLLSVVFSDTELVSDPYLKASIKERL